jgi:mercuric ion binding protein
MPKIILYAALAFGLISLPVALAGEKTVTLAVKNMYCADCPFIVKRSLEEVPGVAKAVVSLKDRTVVVTCDDAKTDVMPSGRGVAQACQTMA